MPDEVKKEEGVTQEPKTPQQILADLQQDCRREVMRVLNKYGMKLDLNYQIKITPK